MPEVRERYNSFQFEKLRQAGNAPIQMGAATIIKKAMWDLVPWVKEFRGMGVFNPLIQIHDDLVFEVGDDILDTVVPIIQSVMENAVTLSVPVLTEPKIGKTWGEME
ncbi:hypothetical protein LCGC14_3007470 [marine sediment metagenome]|uniref:DNA-directed DNA polymerase family A palm domain-containing protein n=1 Tax=marine sediment metagenome TaxID=412755 RepID=A0A0F8ZQF4_9ZZZZ